VWAEGDDAWLPAGAWNERFDVERAIEDGEPVVLGFDGSYSRDATALIGCTLDGHLFKVGIWERPERAPEDWKILRREVDAALADAIEPNRVVELACDPPGWHREIEEWEQTHAEVVVDFDANQPKRMVPACDRFRSAAIEGGLTHDSDPVLARHVANSVARESNSGTVITQPDPTARSTPPSPRWSPTSGRRGTPKTRSMCRGSRWWSPGDRGGGVDAPPTPAAPRLRGLRPRSRSCPTRRACLHATRWHSSASRRAACRYPRRGRASETS
jgi:hypothetical protein